MGKKQAAPVPAPQKKPRSLETKVNMARLFTGGVIAVVTSVDQAIIAERFGARGVIVMDTTAEMATRNRTVLLGADPASTRDVMNMTLIPMVGRVRVGHTMEAKVMESCGVTLIDENEVLAATSTVFIKKHSLDTPCICGVTNLEEALKRLAEGAAMLRSHCVNEDMANINNVVKHYQTIQSDIAELSAKTEEERKTYASEKGVLPHLVSQVVRLGRLPVPFIADGGIMMPIDVAMAMDLGYDGVIVSQQLFRAANPEKRMRSLVLAAIHYKDPMRVAAIAEDSGEIGMPS